MSVVRIREGPYDRGFFKKKCMRILSVHGKLSVIERCPHGEVRLYSRDKSAILGITIRGIKMGSRKYYLSLE